MVRAVFALTTLLLSSRGLAFVQLLLLASLRLEADVTPVAKFPAVVTLLTAKAPGCRLYGHASTTTDFVPLRLARYRLSMKILLIVIRILSLSKARSLKLVFLT